jgi:GntR family transcriptional regulator
MEILQKDTHIPYYLQIKDIIRKRITDHRYPPGTPLPSESKLSAEFEVTRTTVRKSLEELKREGRIHTERGKGSVVAHPKIDQSLLRFYRFGREIGFTGTSASSRLIEIKAATCPPFVARILTQEGKDPQDAFWTQDAAPAQGFSFNQVYSLVRLRFVQEIPLILEFAYLPCALAPNLEQQLKDAAEDSLYNILETAYEVRIGKAKEYLQPKTANEYEAELLNIEPGSAIFETERITMDTSGRIIEVRRSSIRGDKFRFTTELF